MYLWCIRLYIYLKEGSYLGEKSNQNRRLNSGNQSERELLTNCALYSN